MPADINEKVIFLSREDGSRTTIAVSVTAVAYEWNSIEMELFFRPYTFGLWFFGGTLFVLTGIFDKTRSVGDDYLSLLFLIPSSLLGLYLWWVGLGRHRLVEDIPTSFIPSAAQGLVELFGRSTALEGVDPVYAPRGHQALWYRYSVYEADTSSRVGALHSLLSNGFHGTVSESTTLFGISDGETTIQVLPHGGDFICKNSEHWSEEGKHYSLQYILADEPLYVLGKLTTIQPRFNRIESYDELTRDLSFRNPLFRKHDLNNNRRLELGEWKALHREAMRIVDEREREALSRPANHLLSKPDEAQPLIISTIPPEELADQYRWRMVFGFLLFFGAGSASLWIARPLFGW